MSLYRRGGTWWLYITHHGQRFRRSTGEREKKAAQRVHDELKAELWKEQRGGTLHSALRAWSKDKGESDRYQAAKLIREAENVALTDLEAIAAAIPSSNPGTYNRYVNMLRAAGVRGLKRKKNPEGSIRWLTAEEWEKPARRDAGAWLPMADFAIATGLRQANVFWLEWGQVDLARRKAWIHPDEAKARAPIGMPLSDAAMAVLGAPAGEVRGVGVPDAGREPAAEAQTRIGRPW
jgi:integrase